MAVEVEHSLIGKVRMASSFTRMSDTQSELRVASPALGEHTDAILSDLGYGESQIEALRRSGVTA
jgi:crotonobetainyl-CoA:carnitine CoA-transferase CaiB-like acyl-CoA transferase